MRCPRAGGRGYDILDTRTKEEPTMSTGLAIGYAVWAVVAIYTAWDIYQSHRYRRAIEERWKRAGRR